MAEEHIPGAAVAVSKHGELIYQKGFGLRDLEEELPVTPETIFGVASITKSFTALAIMLLEAEGKLSVEDPVIQHLPEFHLQGVKDMSTIKIFHLLSHTTGLAPMRRREELNRLDEHIDYLAEEPYALLGKPGEYFSYCNDTFLLLGAIIERLSGQLYRRFMTERVLNPLGMNRSTFSLEEVDKFLNVSEPYIYNRKKDAHRKVAWPKLGNYEVGGGVRSNVLDLIKYGQAYFSSTLGPTTEQLSKMWNPIIRTDRRSYYGFAFKVTPDYEHQYTLVEHGGGQPGVSSNFGFVPEEGIVVAVLTNVSAVSAGDIWLAAMNTALGLPLGNKRSVEPHYDASREELERFVGEYSSAEGGQIRIYFNGDTLYAELDEQEFELRASDERTMVIVKTEKPIRFFFEEGEPAWAVYTGSRMLTRKQ